MEAAEAPVPELKLLAEAEARDLARALHLREEIAAGRGHEIRTLLLISRVVD